MFGGILVAALVIGAVWFGVAALLSIWPFWPALGVASWAFFAVGEWRARKHDAPRQTLDARLAELEQRGPLSPWAAGIRARETAQPKGGGLLGWLDRL
jgi:hypothetical protein